MNCTTILKCSHPGVNDTTNRCIGCGVDWDELFPSPISAELFQRRELRALLESKSDDFFDKHGNKTPCFTITDVMRLLLEDSAVLDLQKSLLSPSPVIDEMEEMRKSYVDGGKIAVAEIFVDGGDRTVWVIFVDPSFCLADKKIKRWKLISEKHREALTQAISEDCVYEFMAKGHSNHLSCTQFFEHYDSGAVYTLVPEKSDVFPYTGPVVEKSAPQPGRFRETMRLEVDHYEKVLGPDIFKRVGPMLMQSMAHVVDSLEELEAENADLRRKVESIRSQLGEG